jgi:hypothetical protein
MEVFDMTLQNSMLTRKANPRHGVVVNCLEYWSERFLDPELDGKVLRVLPPHEEDVSTIEVEIEGVWVECYCRRYAEMKGVSVSQLKEAMRKMREQKRAMSRMNSALISSFLKECSELESRYQELLRTDSNGE